MIELGADREFLSQTYLLKTDDVERQIMSALSAEIDEGAKELCLRNGAISLHVARICLIRAVAQHLVLNMMVQGKEQDIEQAVLYMARRALYGIQTGQFIEGGSTHAEEDRVDQAMDVLAVHPLVVAEEHGVPDEVPELSEPVLVEAAADQEDEGAALEGA